jgi:hypothetical protein
LLSLAVENEHETNARLLLERGAKLESKDYNSHTALSLAVEKEHEAIVKLLLKRSAELKSKYPSRTALLLAAENGHEAILRLYLDKGAGLESKDCSSRTALWRAMLNGHKATATSLLHRGAELGPKCYSCKVLLAAKNGHKAIVRLLLEKGAELESKEQNGRTTMPLAAGNGHEAAVKLLVEKGAKLESKDNSGQTPLWFVAENRHKVVVMLLLECLDTKYGLYNLWQLAILLFNHLYLAFFFEWTDGQRLLSTTMPWNIPPSLLLLWRVCWMFAPLGQGNRDITSMREGFRYIGNFTVCSGLQLVLRLRIWLQANLFEFHCRPACLNIYL